MLKFRSISSWKRICVSALLCPVVNLQTSSTVFRTSEINCADLCLIWDTIVKRDTFCRMMLLSRVLWCRELIRIETRVLHMPCLLVCFIILSYGSVDDKTGILWMNRIKNTLKLPSPLWNSDTQYRNQGQHQTWALKSLVQVWALKVFILTVHLIVTASQVY